MKKSIVNVNAYLLEEPPEGWKKSIIWVNDYLLEEPPEGPRRDEKTIIRVNAP